jgi:hypothetical protein
MNIIHVDWHKNHLIQKERKYMPIIVHFLLHLPAMTCIEIILFVSQVHVVHEPTVHDLEELVDVFDLNVVEHVEEFPGK